MAARRPPGGCVFELHAHSSDRSLDSGVRAERLVAQAAARGLDGICLTDHNAAWPAQALRDLSERHGIVVLGGMELGTDAGHVLVYGLDRYTPELLVLRRLRAVAQAEGAVLVLAHPMRTFHGHRPGWDEFPRWFDGIEVINGDHSDGESGYLVRQARAAGLSVVGGSDAHSSDAVGRVGTAFPERVTTVADLARLICERRAAPVDFRPR